MNTHAPQKQKRVKYDHQPDWFNSEIAAAIKSRDTAKKQGSINQYKYWRQKVKKQCEMAKKEFYQKTINENCKNPKKLWNNLKEISGKKTTHQTNFIHDDFGNPIEDPLDTAETFNEFFANIFSSANSNITSLDSYNQEVLQNYVQSKIDAYCKFNIPLVSEEFVKKQLSSLNINKSTGLDGIGTRFLKSSVNVIANPITKIINLSISKCKFPQKFKMAKITPIYKKGPKSDRNNYRPISILPVLSKLIEKHITDHLKTFLEENKLLHTQQSGFRTNHSCETALTAVIDNWIEAINNKNLVGTIFLDLTKAFDLVNHSILLQKLKLYNCSTNSIQWFTSYLSNRTQTVSVSGTLSSSRPITAGVPQGSVLGPLLFIIYINDLPLHLNNSDIDMFADDTTVSAYGKSFTSVQNALQTELTTIERWCTQNSMVPNITKTKVMHISATNQIQTPDYSLSLQNTILENSTTEKLLGIHVDQHLNWKQQVDNTLKKCNSYLYLLLRIKNFLSIPSRKLFFNAYILPHLDYCSTIWGNCNNDLLEKLHKFQKRAARVILDKDYLAPTEELFTQLGWMKFNDRVNYKKSILMYKALNNQTPDYIQNKFQHTQDRHNINLRSSTQNKLYVPKPRLEFARKSFAYSGAKLWNDIPQTVQTAQSLAQFKSRYLKWKFTGNV